jgi:hypothetical protein
MGVVVDKARGDDPPGRVDRALGGGAIIFADADNPAVLHRYIGVECRLTRAIDDASVFNENV